MPGVIAELEAKGLTSISEGAEVVQLEGEKVPMLLRTKDGTTLYATRDLASAQWRWDTYHFARSLYVVDRGQAMHFRQVFKTLALMGREWAGRCEHIPFGLVRLGGKKTSTRGGGKQDVILLEQVFEEAKDDVKGRIKAEGLDDAAVEAIARTVGVGAVVFANLAPQRERDVDFEWEKVLSIEGDSGPYLQYSHARCASILRKSGGAAPRDADLTRLTHDAEWAVAKRLLELGDTVARSAAGCEPHILAHYLLDLAGEFSRWYTLGNGDPALRVLCDDADTRAARLALTGAVRAALAHGLGLLGLGAPDVM
jgi:arginyl-tRNA synthetase